jgi:hypothetical protein
MKLECSHSTSSKEYQACRHGKEGNCEIGTSQDLSTPTSKEDANFEITAMSVGHLEQ